MQLSETRRDLSSVPIVKINNNYDDLFTLFALFSSDCSSGDHGQLPADAPAKQQPAQDR